MTEHHDAGGGHGHHDDHEVIRPEIVDGPGAGRGGGWRSGVSDGSWRRSSWAPGATAGLGSGTNDHRRSPLIMRFLLKLIVSAISLWVAVQLIDGLKVDGGALTYLWIALVFGIVNTFVGKVLKLFSLPLILATFGLAIFVINALMLELTDALVRSFEVAGFGSALAGSLIISLVSMVLNFAVKRLQ